MTICEICKISVANLSKHEKSKSHLKHNEVKKEKIGFDPNIEYTLTITTSKSMYDYGMNGGSVYMEIYPTNPNESGPIPGGFIYGIDDEDDFCGPDYINFDNIKINKIINIID